MRKWSTIASSMWRFCISRCGSGHLHSPFTSTTTRAWEFKHFISYLKSYKRIVLQFLNQLSRSIWIGSPSTSTGLMNLKFCFRFYYCQLLKAAPHIFWESLVFCVCGQTYPNMFRKPVSIMFLVLHRASPPSPHTHPPENFLTFCKMAARSRGPLADVSRAWPCLL